LVKRLNDQAVRDGSRIFSAYAVAGEKLYAITEWDRSYTLQLYGGLACIGVLKVPLSGKKRARHMA
jgi:hypothetical protein